MHFQDIQADGLQQALLVCGANDVRPCYQGGFCKGYSCLDNLAFLKFDIVDALKSHEHVLAMYSDVTNAFNEVHCDILLQLVDIGLSTKVLKFIKFLTYLGYKERLYGDQT